jgi:hypothetical protein
MAYGVRRDVVVSAIDDEIDDAVVIGGRRCHSSRD